MSEEIIATQKPTPGIFTRPGDYLTLRVDSQDRARIVWSVGRDNEMDIYYGNYQGSQIDLSASTKDESPYSFLIVIFALVLIPLTIKSQRKVLK